MLVKLFLVFFVGFPGAQGREMLEGQAVAKLGRVTVVAKAVRRALADVRGEPKLNPSRPLEGVQGHCSAPKVRTDGPDFPVSLGALHFGPPYFEDFSVCHLRGLTHKRRRGRHSLWPVVVAFF